MSTVVTQVLVVLHVACAGYWFGAAAGVPRRLKTLLQMGAEDAKKLAPGLKKDGALLGLAAVLVFLTGLALIFSVGGFKAVHPRIHASMGIALLWMGVGAGFVRPNLAAIVEAAENGEPLEPQRGRVKKVAAGIGVGHLLFVVMLTLMLWRM